MRWVWRIADSRKISNSPHPGFLWIAARVICEAMTKLGFRHISRNSDQEHDAAKRKHRSRRQDQLTECSDFQPEALELQIEGFVLAILAILFACVTSSCSSTPMPVEVPVEMPYVPQPPPPPMNVARLLNGNWMATYPGGPLRVVIGLDPMILGRNYVATLVDGDKDIPPGQVVWKGTLDQNVPGIVVADQICAEQGFLLARWVKARIVVSDASNFSEELVNPSACHGFPVTFTRVGPAPTEPITD